MHTDIYPANNESTNELLSQFVDINQLITIKEKTNFITNIFYGNFEDYQRTINKLNSMNSWELSHNMLSQVFSERNIYEFSKHARMLSTIVFSRYYPAYSMP